jgi:hypothetical protein
MGRAVEAALRACSVIAARSVCSKAPSGHRARAGLAGSWATHRASQAKRFGTVAGPQQAECALWAWAELGFGLEAD